MHEYSNHRGICEVLLQKIFKKMSTSIVNRNGKKDGGLKKSKRSFEGIS